jgi:hypothetical protein
MRDMDKGRVSRWKKWVGNDVIKVLENATIELKSAWKADMRSPDHYPIWTDIVFGETVALLQGKPLKPKHGPIKLPPLAPPPAPLHLSELLKEETVKSVYGLQNNGSYEDALKIAATRDEKAYSTFRKLLRAIEAAYEIDYCSSGFDAIPKPRVHFLHRNLLQIADSENLQDLTLQGTVEFFDDICPCGKKHKTDAIRKLKKRSSRAANTKR